MEEFKHVALHMSDFKPRAETVNHRTRRKDY